MKYVRHKCNCILWALYSLIICASLTFFSKEICIRHFPYLEDWYMAITGAVLLLLLLLLFFLFFPLPVFGVKSGASGGGEEGMRFRRRERLFLLGAGVTMAVFRVMAAFGPEGAWGAGREASSAGPAVLAVRIAVQVLGGFFLYLSLRILASKDVAVFVAAGLAVHPFMIRMCILDGKGDLYFCFFTLLILAAALSGRSALDPGRGFWARTILTGLVYGSSVRVDPLFASPLLLCLSVVLRVEGIPSRRDRGRMVCILLSAAFCGFVSTALGQWYFLDMQMQMRPPVSGWRNVIGLFQGFRTLDPLSLYSLAVLACLSGLHMFGFFVKEGTCGDPWFLPFLFLNGLFCIMEIPEGGQALLSLWLIFSGMGFHGMACMRKARREDGTSDGCPPPEEKGKGRPALQPGEPIPNPLPGPKRHVRRELDYAFIPEEDKMCYDIPEIGENDDFEI